MLSVPGQGVYKRQPIDVSLLLMFLSLSLSLPSLLSEINKQVLSEDLKNKKQGHFAARVEMLPSDFTDQ